MPRYRLTVEYMVTRNHEFEAEDEEQAEEMKWDYIANDQFDLGYDAEIWSATMDEE